MRTETIRFRVSKLEKDIIKNRARKCNLRLSEFCRNTIFDKRITYALTDGNEFLIKFREPQAEYLLLIKETMKRVAEEQNKLNEETRKLNSKLYDIQAEVKKLSKVGFDRLPNYLVAVLVGVLGFIVLWLLILFSKRL